MHVYTIAKVLITWALSLIILVLGFTLFASAQDGEWLPRRWKKQKPYVYHQNHYRPVDRSPLPRWQYRDAGRGNDDPRCLGRLFFGTGTEATSEENALKSAERSWGALIRYDHGEKWMDLKYAINFSSRCQRSSTGESVTAKITESLTGGSLGILYRCRIWAEPCTAPRSQDEGRDK